jgi:endonuclease/exonuclease/phosphatase family metal-dependent hydrolase
MAKQRGRGEAMRLRIVTLNAWAFPEPLAERLDERMDALVERIPALGADVLALQEVWAAAARERLVAGGAAAGLAHVRASDGAFLGGGLLLLSRLPVTATRFESYALNGVPHRPAHPDYYGGKGFLVARVATEVGPLALVNTHLHARYGSDVDHEYAGHRAAQWVQLASALASLRGPVCLAGDFNFDDDHDEYRAFTGLTGARDAGAAVGCLEPTVWRANPYRRNRVGPDHRIDFVFARDGLAHDVRPTAARRVFDEVLERDGERFAVSDHAGVLAELEIEPRAARRLPPPAPAAVAFAAELLERGAERAERRRGLHRRRAGMGLGAGIVAAAALRAGPLTRRAFLRASLRGTTLLAFGGTLGSGLVAEVYGPSEVEGFDAARRALARLAVGDAPPGPDAGG